MKIDTTNLNNRKNLLAFSSGVDSTALFFILLEHQVSFDIAIVNYHLRNQSNNEVSYAKQLAIKYNKKCYIKNVNISSNNLEQNARNIRYSYFEELIKNYQYDNLLTAHQLNDKLEWFLMQFTKGAGIIELQGIKEFGKRDKYNLIRPILNYSKNKLIKYLDKNNIKYFIDKTNFDDKYKRNYFRKEFSNRLLKEFENGIQNSFSYISKDIKLLNINYNPILKIDSLVIFNSYNNHNKNIRVIDHYLKYQGYIISSKQRVEIIKQKEIIIDKYCISIRDNYIWISPNISDIKLDKKFKELCRINKIPKKHRVYIKKQNIDIEKLINIYKLKFNI